MLRDNLSSAERCLLREHDEIDRGSNAADALLPANLAWKRRYISLRDSEFEGRRGREGSNVFDLGMFFEFGRRVHCIADDRVSPSNGK